MIPIHSASSASDSGASGLAPNLHHHSIPPRCGGRGMLKRSRASVTPLDGIRAKKWESTPHPPLAALDEVLGRWLIHPAHWLGGHADVTTSVFDSLVPVKHNLSSSRIFSSWPPRTP